MSSTWRLALVLSFSASTSSMYLPWRTSPTLPKPRPCSACCTALPWGSSTPLLRVMWTFAFNAVSSDFNPGLWAGIGSLLQSGGAFHVGGPALGQNPQAPRHFLISFLDPAQVAAEAILVHLLVGLGIPQPHVVGGKLVRQHYLYVAVLVEQPTELHLEVDQA